MFTVTGKFTAELKKIIDSLTNLFADKKEELKKQIDKIPENAVKGTSTNAAPTKENNPSIASVDSNGVITGKKAGKTSIYVFARNGYAKEIKVTVP